VSSDAHLEIHVKPQGVIESNHSNIGTCLSEVHRNLPALLVAHESTIRAEPELLELAMEV
jgi:hypothetical protein